MRFNVNKTLLFVLLSALSSLSFGAKPTPIPTPAAWKTPPVGPLLITWDGSSGIQTSLAITGEVKSCEDASCKIATPFGINLSAQSPVNLAEVNSGELLLVTLKVNGEPVPTDVTALLPGGKKYSISLDMAVAEDKLKAAKAGTYQYVNYPLCVQETGARSCTSGDTNVALVTLQVVIAPFVIVQSLSDLDLGTWSGSAIDLIASSTFCVGTNTGSGPLISISVASGALEMSGTGTNTDTILYSLDLDGTALTHGGADEPAPKFHNLNCTGGSDATLTATAVVVGNVDSVQADGYSQTVQIMVAPN